MSRVPTLAPMWGRGEAGYRRQVIESHPRPATSGLQTGQRRVHVAVVSGGPGAEHEVSVRSGRAIVDALLAMGNTVTSCVVSRDGTWRMGRTIGLGPAIAALGRADVVIPALHGPWGEDGTFQGVLETIGVPYVGSGVLSSATCMDKERTKLVLRPRASRSLLVASVRTPPDGSLVEELVSALGLPVFVKPVAWRFQLWRQPGDCPAGTGAGRGGRAGLRRLGAGRAGAAGTRDRSRRAGDGGWEPRRRSVTRDHQRLDRAVLQHPGKVCQRPDAVRCRLRSMRTSGKHWTTWRVGPSGRSAVPAWPASTASWTRTGDRS